jgi:hypothetical protein
MATRRRARRKQQPQRRSKNTAGAKAERELTTTIEPRERSLPEVLADVQRMPRLIFNAGDPRAELARLAMEFKGPEDENRALFELRKHEALMGGDVGEHVRAYLRVRSEGAGPNVGRAAYQGRASEVAALTRAINELRRSQSPTRVLWRNAFMGSTPPTPFTPLFRRWQRADGAVQQAAETEPGEAQRRRKQKLPDDILDEHLKEFPLDTPGANGRPLSPQRRCDILEAKYGVKIKRSTMAKRLKEVRQRQGQFSDHA